MTNREGLEELDGGIEVDDSGGEDERKGAGGLTPGYHILPVHIRW